MNTASVGEWLGGVSLVVRGESRSPSTVTQPRCKVGYSLDTTAEWGEYCPMGEGSPVLAHLSGMISV